MALHSLILLFGLTAAANEQVIDAFQYKDAQAARVRKSTYGSWPGSPCLARAP